MEHYRVLVLHALNLIEPGIKLLTDINFLSSYPGPREQDLSESIRSY